MGWGGGKESKKNSDHKAKLAFPSLQKGRGTKETKNIEVECKLRTEEITK